MTSPASPGTNSRTDSKLVENQELNYPENRPEKRPRRTSHDSSCDLGNTSAKNSCTSSTSSSTTTTCTTTSSTSSSTSSTCIGTTSVSKRNVQQVAVATTTSESGNLFGGSSRMYVFRRGRGRALRYYSSPDYDPLRDSWSSYGHDDGSEEEASSSETEEDAKHSKTDLEWTWDEESKSKACTLTNRNTEVRFHLDYSCGTAAARGTQSMCDGQHYWEIKMASAVYGTDMMIGLGTQQVNMGEFSHTFCSMLGSDVNAESCGLSYTGHFHSSGIDKMYCNKYGQGTVIGVHLDMWFGTVTFFKNGKCLGIAGKGLLGKAWHPMVSSTAARSSMRLVKARSFPSSLQFWCCAALRKAIPPDLSVLEVLELPPGLRSFLGDNLSWLLGANHTRGEVECKSKGTQTVLSTTAVQRRIRTQQR